MTPFPQADNIELVYNLFFDISPDGISKEFVTNKYGYTERQGSYYLDALCFIGLAQKINSKYFLTSKGAELRLIAQDDLKSTFCKMVLENGFLRETYEIYKRYDGNDLAELISKKIYDKYDLSESTTMRRAKTVTHWLEWLDNNLEEEIV